MLAWMTAATGAECVPVAAPPQELAVSAAKTLMVRGGHGTFDVRRGPGDTIRVEVTSCDPQPPVRLSDRHGAVSLRSDTHAARPATVRITLPDAVTAISVSDVHGRIEVHDVAARVSVVSSQATVVATAVPALTVAFVRGDVVAERIAGDVVITEVDGRLFANQIAGELRYDGVSGTVVTDAGDAGT